MNPLWNYRARVERIVDGDTLDMTVDVGFHMFTLQRLRLLGVDTPELRAADPTVRLAAKAAAAATLMWTDAATAFDLSEKWPFVIHTEKSDSFGRWLATVETRDGVSLNQYLLASGFAVPFR